MPPFMQPSKPSGNYRQDLTGASNGKITGANGGTQQLGPNAMRRIAAQGGTGTALPPPPGPGRTPPIMDPSQKPPLPGFSAQPGMTPYMPPGGATGSGSVDPGTAGDPMAKLSQFGPGGGQTPGIVPNMPGGSPNISGSGVGGGDPSASLISKLNGGMMQVNGGGASSPETFQTSPLPGFTFGGSSPGAGGASPGFNTLPAMAEVHPGFGAPGMMGGSMAPPSPTGKEPMPAPAPGGQFVAPGVRPPMNTKPLPGRRPVPETGSSWGGLAAAGGGAVGPGGGIQTGMGGPRRGMASF